MVFSGTERWRRLATKVSIGIWDVVAQKKVHSFGNRTLYDLPYALAWSKDGSHIITIAVDYPQANWHWL